MLGREDVVPGMIAAIQTSGQLLHWNPHIHSLVTCGAYTPGSRDIAPRQCLYLASCSLQPDMGDAD
jgi:hypothetical protein